MGDIIIQGDREGGELQQPDDFYLARIAALESRLRALEDRHSAHEQVDMAAHVEIAAQAEEAQEIAEEAQELAAESALMATLATIEQEPEAEDIEDGETIEIPDGGGEEGSESGAIEEEIRAEESGEDGAESEPEPVILSIEPEPADRKPERTYRFARGRRR